MRRRRRGETRKHPPGRRLQQSPHRHAELLPAVLDDRDRRSTSPLRVFSHRRLRLVKSRSRRRCEIHSRIRPYPYETPNKITSTRAIVPAMSYPQRLRRSASSSADRCAPRARGRRLIRHNDAVPRHQRSTYTAPTPSRSLINVDAGREPSATRRADPATSQFAPTNQWPAHRA